MPRNWFRVSPASSKTKKSSSRRAQSGALPMVLWVLGLSFSVWSTWVIVFPSSSGAAGSYVSGIFHHLLGLSAYALPVYLAYGLFLLMNPAKSLSWVMLGLGFVMSLCAAANLLTLLGGWAGHPGWGGLTGDFLSGLLVRISGGPGAFIASMAGLLIGLHFYFDISWKEVWLGLSSAVAEDTAAWLEARRKLKDDLARAKKDGPVVAVPVPGKKGKDNAKDAKDAKGAKDEKGKGEEGKPEVEPLPPSPLQQPGKAKEFIASLLKEKEAKKPAKAENGSVAEPKPQPKAAPAPIKVNGSAAPASGDLPVYNTYENYQFPPLSLLKPGGAEGAGRPSDEEIATQAALLERTLATFEIEARVTGVSPGPVITRYELAPAAGVKVSSITNLSNDLALALKAKSIRIIAPIPGKAAVGIEIPNPKPAMVTLREILESPAFQQNRPVPFALGRAAEGDPIVADVAAMPHLLVAGATNSGKSVLVHDLILSLLYRCNPKDLKLVLIDPKVLELTFYQGIPHLYDPLTPWEEVRVITDPKMAARTLKKLVRVMELRYQKFAAYGVRNIDGYNEEAARRGEPGEFYIVVIIDELADLMLSSQDAVEDSIQRLAQMARAVGIHLVLATQRPSVDVITGVIKANLPTRVALAVRTGTDSRVIIDSTGAETLLGKGDFLYLSPGSFKSLRVQAPYVSEAEIKKVVDFCKTQGAPSYPPMEAPGASMVSEDGKGANIAELRAALQLVLERRRVSQDLLKAHFGSSAKATDLLSLLEVRGFISKPEGTNRWEISYDKMEEYLKAVKPPGMD